MLPKLSRKPFAEIVENIRTFFLCYPDSLSFLPILFNQMYLKHLCSLMSIDTHFDIVTELCYVYGHKSQLMFRLIFPFNYTFV